MERWPDDPQWRRPQPGSPRFEVRSAVAQSEIPSTDPAPMWSSADQSIVHIEEPRLVTRLRYRLVRDLRGELAPIELPGTTWLMRGDGEDGFWQAVKSYDIDSFGGRDLVRAFVDLSDSAARAGARADAADFGHAVALFANKYGPLGIAAPVHQISDSRHEGLHMVVNVSEDAELGEALTDWQDYVLSARRAYDALEALRRNDADSVRRLARALRERSAHQMRADEVGRTSPWPLGFAPAGVQDRAIPAASHGGEHMPQVMIDWIEVFRDIRRSLAANIREHVRVALIADEVDLQVLPILEPTSLVGIIWLQLLGMAGQPLRYARCEGCNRLYPVNTTSKGGGARKRAASSRRHFCTDACRQQAGRARRAGIPDSL